MNSSIDESSDYSLLVAKKHVEEYIGKDQLMTLHHDAMKCRDCEDFLQTGIDAYTWLSQAEATAHEAARKGISVSPAVVEAIKVLYRCWLGPCDRAEAKIQEQLINGHSPGNLEPFRKACDEVSKRIQEFDVYDAIEDAFTGRMFDEDFVRAAGEILSR